MRKMTVTEALAEIRVLEKRLDKERNFAGQFCARISTVRDPLEKEGGSPAAVAASVQKIADLEANVVAIRKAIQDANAATELSIDTDFLPSPVTTVQTWLMWKREVMPKRIGWINGVLQAIERSRNEIRQKHAGGVKVGDVLVDVQLTVDIDEAALRAESKELEAMVEKVDGLLNLKNATTVIEIP